ncbi:MAG: DUF1622 domain-containing protein [Thermoproteota archaeon]
MSEEGSIEISDGSSLEHVLSLVIEYVSFGIDVASGFIIGTSVVIALIGYVKTLSTAQEEEGQGPKRESIRFRLAGGLLLALDFQVGSDILKTILVPTTNELIILAVIVALRIVLGWSLSREISGHSEDLLTK